MKNTVNETLTLWRNHVINHQIFHVQIDFEIQTAHERYDDRSCFIF